MNKTEIFAALEKFREKSINEVSLSELFNLSDQIRYACKIGTITKDEKYDINRFIMYMLDVPEKK